MLMNLGDRLERARRCYGPPWPPALARYLDSSEPKLTAEVLEDLKYLEAIREVSWPGQMPVVRSGL